MKVNIIERLFASLDELEAAIKSTRAVLDRRRDIKKELYEDRLDTYNSMLEKQKTLATDLDIYMKTHTQTPTTSEEIRRRLDLINGLSFMLRDDARELVLELTYKKKTTKGDTGYD